MLRPPCPTNPIPRGNFSSSSRRNFKRSTRACRRRIRNYWIAIAVINIPLGLFAYKIGHGLAIPFVCAIAGMALATSWLTWQTFFLRTEY